MFVLLAAAIAGPLPAAGPLPVAGAVDLVPAGATDWPPKVPGLTFGGPQGNDALALRGPKTPKAPVSWAADPATGGRWLVVAWAARDGGAWGEVGANVVWQHAGAAPTVRQARLGVEIPFAEAAASGPGTSVVTAGGQVFGVTLLPNPHPDLPVTHVEITSRRVAGSLTLYAVSLVDTPPFPVPPEDPHLTGFPFPIRPDGPPLPQPDDLRVAGPAGAAGFVTVRDGHLAFEHGGRARFWGVNLLNEGALPEKEAATVLARQLAGAGVNLVRLHHLDSPRVGVVREDRTADPATLFDAAKLDRLDWFVAELKRNGVYVLLEVATNRTFTAVDGVSGPDPTVPNGHKLLPFFAADWHDAYLAWTRAWLGRTNRYTGLRYADDPVVAMVELVNEDSLLVNWFSTGIEKLPAAHRATLDARWNTFLASRYADEAAIRAAWTGSVNPGLRPGEAWGAVRRDPVGQGFFESWPRRRVEDLYDFYVGLEEGFLAEVAATVRGLGYRVPLVPGITYQSTPLARIQAAYDVIDIHLEWDSVGPEDTLRGTSAVEEPRAQFLFDRLPQAQAGKPFIASEINGAYPNPTTAELPFVYAGLAAVQDWDALVWLNYTNGPFEAEPTLIEGMYELRANAAKWGQFGVASALFRSGALAPAPGLFPIVRTDAAVKVQATTGMRPTFVELRDPAFVLAHRIREVYGAAAPLPVPGAPSTEVGWWPEASRFVVDDDRWQAVVGRGGREGGEGGGPARARFLDPRLADFAATSLTSLDAAPFPACRHALLTVAGRMTNAGMVTGAGGTTVLDWGAAPSTVVNPTGRVRFAWPVRPTVRPRGPDGSLGEAVEVKPDGRGWWAVEVVPGTIWWDVS